MSVIVQRDGGNKPGQDIEIFLKEDLSQLERGRQAINESYLNLYNLSCQFIEAKVPEIGSFLSVSGVVGETIETGFSLSIGDNLSSTYRAKIEVPLP